MGLDVYLRKCANLEAAKAAEEAASNEINALWEAAGGYNKASEADKERIRGESEKVALKHGLRSVYGHHESIIEFDEVQSKIDPEHLFKCGYLRSSYNPVGINNVMRNLGLPDLYEIFGVGRDEYDIKPDWEASLARVNDAIERYSAHLESDAGKFTVSEVRPMFQFGVADEEAALELFMDQFKKRREGDDDFNSYSNRDGEFTMGKEPRRVRAVITKKYTPSANDNPISRLLNTPSVFLVCEKEPQEKEDFYLTALKITREMIEFVLAQPDKQHFYMTWSG